MTTPGYLRRWVTVTISLLLLAGITPARSQDIEVLRDITFANPDGTPLKLDLFTSQLTTGKMPVVLVIYGGSWIANGKQAMRPLAEMLSAHGYAVVSADYRLAPIHTYPAQLDDMRAAARWVRDNAERYRFDMARFTALGVSAGGHLAAMLGVLPVPNTPRVTSVVAICSPFDLTAPVPSFKAQLIVKAYLGASRDDRPDLYAQASPVTHVTPDDPPFLIAHGTKDELVPYNQSVRMAEALKNAGVPCSFVSLAKLGHALPDDPNLMQNSMDTLLAFLASPSTYALAQ